MVQIIAFPGKAPSSVVDTSTLSFPDDGVMPVPRVGATLDGMLVVSVLKEAEAFPGGDWTNQELADLYRVESLLIQAGIKLSTGRGLTDEDDPWFVFCREDGDVFVHLARADGRYLLASPGVDGLLEGMDFQALINRFVEQLTARRQPEDVGNIINFRPKMLKDNSVLLHPAVMLAALIWTLYLSSDDFASTTEAAIDLADDALLPVDQLIKLDAQETQSGEDASALALQEGDVGGDAKAAHENKAVVTGPAFQEGDRSGHGVDRMLSGQSMSMSGTASATQAVTASLAIIAFSYGLYGPQPNKEDGIDASTGLALAELDEALKLLAENGAVALHLDGDAAPVITQEDLQAEPIVLQRLPSDIALDAGNTASLELQLDVVSVLPEAGDLPITDIADREAIAPIEASGEAFADTAPQTQHSERSSDTAQTSSTSDDNSDAGQREVAEPRLTITKSSDDVATSVSNKDADTEPDRAVVQAPAVLDQDDFKKFVGLLDDADSTGPSENGDDGRYGLGNGSGRDEFASNDPVKNKSGIDTSDTHVDSVETMRSTDESAESVTSAPEPDQPETSVVGAAINVLDAQADFFVFDISSKNRSFETVFFDVGDRKELVVYDTTAIDDADDQAFALSWVNDDGVIISVVGHYQDFVDYGMA